MARCRVVQPETVRLSLSDGDFLDVKKELNAGEYFDLLNDMVARVPFSHILHYVVGWSLIGLDGKPLPYTVDLPATVRRDTVWVLDKGTTREMIAALNRHESVVEQEREKTRALPFGEGASSTTSPSAG